MFKYYNSTILCICKCIIVIYFIFLTSAFQYIYHLIFPCFLTQIPIKFISFIKISQKVLPLSKIVIINMSILYVYGSVNMFYNVCENNVAYYRIYCHLWQYKGNHIFPQNKKKVYQVSSITYDHSIHVHIHTF